MYSFFITTAQVICIFYLREVMNVGSDSDTWKFDNRKKSSWFLAHRLHLAYPTLCFIEIRYLKIHLSGILSQTLDLEKLH